MRKAILNWLIEKLIVLRYETDDSWLGTNFGYDEHTDFMILVNHYYDDYYSIGTRSVEYEAKSSVNN